MNESIRQMESEPEKAHVDGAALGSERPAFEIPSHPPTRPYVMPIHEANARLSTGDHSGVVGHALGGITGTSKKLITHRDGQPVMSEKPGADPLLPKRGISEHTSGGKTVGPHSGY